MDRITLSCGSGGRMMHQLIDSLFMKEFSNSILSQRKDSAILKLGDEKIAFTTDTYVVDPIFFPGGDIGSLAVNGTINDISVCGAKPIFISLGLVIEEGLPKAVLDRVIKSVGAASRAAGVKVVTGDTKVVERGSADKIFINTSGIGKVSYENLSVGKIKPGDVVLVSGPIGDHAISVLSVREGIAFRAKVKSDSAPLNGLIFQALKVSKNIAFMRDPTRGGLATTLNEITKLSGFGIALEEKEIPVREGVREACELLGLDPLYLACEGRVVIIVSKNDAAKVLSAVRKSREGRAARIIGTVTKEHKGRVYLNTLAGSSRVLDMLSGEQLPRIC
ncbi:MAG: hydrogenase expression/formation protein HypE [Candidatus Omnitrophica bacterium]|nr:hydrogenase expression/formation protein HypE [Candidatus Omnitrophota bacterium]